jgi:hypothetical protein
MDVLDRFPGLLALRFPVHQTLETRSAIKQLLQT